MKTRGAKRPRERTASAALRSETSRASASRAGGFPIVGVGASAGGLEAFSELLKRLPADTGMGFVLVQHLDPQHESALTGLLAKVTSLPVREVADSLRVEPNHVYVIPPNANLGIVRGVLKLHPRDATQATARSIDFFFEALAQDQRERAIGVILSGTASDGTLGLEAIKAEGGITFAQDASARYDSMPRSAVAAGCVDFVLTPEMIARELARIAKHPYVQGAPTRASGQVAALPPSGGSTLARRVSPAESAFKEILRLVRSHSGVDFSLYKTSTIQRRIQRRIVLSKLDSDEAYVSHLRHHPVELSALYSDLLIGVTTFFRNPEAFEFLQRYVFPRIVPERRDDPLRIWVLGCSTGQEAYSLVMAFEEIVARLPRAPALQVFATDLNDALLDKARRGLYAKNLVADVSPERLHRFFVEEQGGYRIVKAVRDTVVFSRHNLLLDPPFSRMDLISCRNLLIYLEPSLQQKIIPTFHYALRPKGCLLLGAAESIGAFTELFEPLDRKQKIYARKAGLSPALPARLGLSELEARKSVAAPRTTRAQKIFPLELNAEREADRVTRNRYAPPGVLVNADFVVMEFRGDTSAFLKPAAGHASFQVLKMAREGLMLPLRAALNKAKRENKTIRQEEVRVTHYGANRKVNFEVTPLKNMKERCYLIFFEEATTTARAPGAGATPPVRPSSKKEESRRLRELEVELVEARDYAQSLQEQQDVAFEELQSSNEEVTSANEELQSVNEELETSKEELESSNEELTTINEEMAHRNGELSRLNSDLLNFQTSTKLAILLLQRDLTIRRFSSAAEKFFNLIAADIGRPISALRHTLELANLEGIASEVVATVREREIEVRDKEGRWYFLRLRPYLTVDNKVDGVVLVLVDITDLKLVEREAQSARAYAEAMIRTLRDPLLVLRGDLRVNTASDAFYKMFATTPDQTVGRSIFELAAGAWDIVKLRALLDDILVRNGAFKNFEVTQDFPGIGRRTMVLNARRLDLHDGALPMILLAVEDVTELRHVAEQVRTSELRFRRLFEAAHNGVLILDFDSQKITHANPFVVSLLGYTEPELRGKELWEIGIFADAQTSLEEFRVLQEKGVIRYEILPLRTKSGDHRIVELVANRYYEGGTKVIQFILRDITERKKSEEALRKSEVWLRLLFEDARDFAIISMDRHGHVTDWNAGAETLFGFTAEEIIGRETGVLFTLDDQAAGAPKKERRAAEGESFVLEDRWHRRKTGERFFASSAMRSLRDDGGNLLAFVKIMREITERKRP